MIVSVSVWKGFFLKELLTRYLVTCKTCFSYIQSIILINQSSNGLVVKCCNGVVVKASDSQSRGPMIKATGGSKINSVFYPTEVDQLKSWSWMVKSKLSPRSGSVALRQLNLIHKKGHKVFFSILRRWPTLKLENQN